MKEKDSVILTKLGANVLKIRTSKGFSQDDVSLRCEVDRAKISKIENGTANYNITTFIELAKGLEIDPKDLLNF